MDTNDTVYEIATLFVPNAESKMAYQEAEEWRNFTKIEVEAGSSGVDSIIGDVDNIVPVECYNLQGVKVDSPEAGCIYIVKQVDKTNIVLVK